MVGFRRRARKRKQKLGEVDLAGESYIALFLDGKTFADATMVVAMGVTSQGDKRFLGFVETDTENEKVLTLEALRAMYRGLPENVETTTFGHPTFQAGKTRTFAVLGNKSRKTRYTAVIAE